MKFVFQHKPFMKNLITLCLLVLTTVQLSYAQSTDVMSAYNKLTEWNTEKNVESLAKAKDFIDDAIRKLTDKGMLAEPNKLAAKAFNYRGDIYTALAQQKEKPELAVGASSIAFDAYNKAMEMDDKGKLKSKITRGLAMLSGLIYQDGNTAYQAGDFATSFDLFSKVMQIDEMNQKSGNATAVDTLAILATAYSAEKSGQADKALPLYEKLIDLNYSDPGIFFSMAKIHRAAGDDEKANEVLAQGREKFPESKAIIIEEVNYLLSQGKQSEAIGKMEKAIELDDSNASLHFALGTAYDSTGDTDKAVASYSKALELDPDYFDALYNLAAVYYNQAAEKTREMNEVDFNDTANYDRLKGESNDLFNKALPFFERALTASPNELNTLTALKEIHANLGDFKKSTEYKTKIEELTK